MKFSWFGQFHPSHWISPMWIFVIHVVNFINRYSNSQFTRFILIHVIDSTNFILIIWVICHQCHPFVTLVMIFSLEVQFHRCRESSSISFHFDHVINLIRETQFHMPSRVQMASYIFAQFHPWTMFHACGMFDCQNFTWGLDLNFICFKKKKNWLSYCPISKWLFCSQFSPVCGGYRDHNTFTMNCQPLNISVFNSKVLGGIKMFWTFPHELSQPSSWHQKSWPSPTSCLQLESYSSYKCKCQ